MAVIPQEIFKAFSAFVSTNGFKNKYFPLIAQRSNTLTATNGSIAAIVGFPGNRKTLDADALLNPVPAILDAFIDDSDEIELQEAEDGQIEGYPDVLSLTQRDGINIAFDAVLLKKMCDLAIAIAEEDGIVPRVVLTLSGSHAPAIFTVCDTKDWSAEMLVMPVDRESVSRWTIKSGVIVYL